MEAIGIIAIIILVLLAFSILGQGMKIFGHLSKRILKMTRNTLHKKVLSSRLISISTSHQLIMGQNGICVNPSKKLKSVATIIYKTSSGRNGR